MVTASYRHHRLSAFAAIAGMVPAFIPASFGPGYFPNAAVRSGLSVGQDDRSRRRINAARFRAV